MYEDWDPWYVDFKYKSMECEKKVGHVTEMESWDTEITIESEKNENKEKKKWAELMVERKQHVGFIVPK